MDVQEGRTFIPPFFLRAKSSQLERSFDLHSLTERVTLDGGELIFGTMIANMAPELRGSISLAGKEPELPPCVDFRFFRDKREKDAHVLKDGLLIARNIWNCEPMKSLVEREILPGSKVREAPEILEYVKKNNMIYNHPVGTCKMGRPSDQDSVVDFKGLVIGTEYVLVADASIIPVIPHVNPNLTCMLIGLKIAKGILSSTSCCLGPETS